MYIDIDINSRQSLDCILIGWLVVHILQHKALLCESQTSVQIKFMSFGLITQCSTYTICWTVHTLTYLFLIYSISNFHFIVVEYDRFSVVILAKTITIHQILEIWYISHHEVNRYIVIYIPCVGYHISKLKLINLIRRKIEHFAGIGGISSVLLAWCDFTCLALLHLLNLAILTWPYYTYLVSSTYSVLLHKLCQTILA